MTRNRTLTHAAVLAALLAPAHAQKKGEGVGWPFGEAAARGGATASMHKRDLFNLGLLGAKAWDADREEPKVHTRGGRRQFKSSGKHGEDVGPKRLVVRALLGGGPASKAGLKIDDVIVGVGQTSFDEGSFGPLATAIRNAEAGDGKVMLQIERGGETKQLVCKISKGGKAALVPTEGKHRDKILKQTLGWLAKRQGGDGGYPQTLGGNNGAVVMSCLAGLAWIAGGSSLKGGKHKANLEKASKFVIRGLYAEDPFASARGGGTANWDQTTWAFAHAGVFLGELLLAGKNKKLKAELQKIADTICKRQEASGGYGHGPGGKNALGYIELNILGAYSLCALSLAKQAGCTIDDEVVTKLNAYLEESASSDGGVGYSTAPGQKGSGNIGRTAAAWLGAVGLGLGDDEWTQKMESYVKKNIANVQGGHASLQQHVLLAGVAARAIGQGTLKDFWDGGLRRDFTLARSPDGSFQPRPWHESLTMSSNTDVSMGEVWTTASWAIILAADRRKNGKGGLPGWCGLKKK